MTTINFNLSSALQTQLQQPGVYAYAVSFYTPTGGSSTAGPTSTLVSNGVLSSSLSMTMPTNFPSGVVYVVIQQGGNGGLLGQLSTVGSINPSSASTNNYSYQLFEASLTPLPTDQGDISALNTFGFPSSYSVSSNNQTLSLGFLPGLTGNTIYTSLGGTIQTFSNNGGNALTLGPATANNAAPFAASDWLGYLNALKGNAAALADITLVVPFAGGTSLQASPMLSQYGVQYVSSDSFGSDYFWLVPNTQNKATNTDWIYIPASTSTATAGSLLNNIYVQPGPLQVYPDNGSGAPSTTPLAPFAGGSFTPNNADGAVAKFLVAGFDAGYWGGNGTSANPADPTVSDLSKTWNWNINYAYNASLTSTAIKYYNTLTGGSVSSPSSSPFFDHWAQYIQKNSNAYGYSYTDLVSLGGNPNSPQITLWDPSLNANVANINIGLFTNSETLPATSGYTAPPSVYVAPTGQTYTQVNKATSGNINEVGFAFQFALSTLNFAPDNSTPAAIRWYAPDDPMAKAANSNFVSLSIPSLTGTILSNSQSITSIWNTLSVSGGPGTWSLVANSGPIFSQQLGQFQIYNLPVTADGTTGWYQLLFGSGDDQTVYNFYANNVNGVFQPITGSGSNPNNFVIDHGVEIQQATTPAGYYTLNFAPGANILYDIDTLSPPDTQYGTNAANAMVGTSGNDVFNGGPGNDSIAGAAGSDMAMTWEASRNFAVSTAVGSGTITVRDKVGRDGTDTLSSIEQIRFGDRTIDAASITKTAAQTSAQIMKVVDLYTAGLNRAPDALGLDYYVAKLADGTSLSDIAKSIFGSAEAAPIYSATNSNPVFVQLAYQNALGHAPDAAGLAYWTNELNTGHLVRTDFVTALIAGATGTDKQYITNKETVGAHFALTAGLNNVNWARAVESAVDATASTVSAANAQTDAFAVIANTSATSELVVQITGIVP